MQPTNTFHHTLFPQRLTLHVAFTITDISWIIKLLPDTCWTVFYALAYTHYFWSKLCLNTDPTSKFLSVYIPISLNLSLGFTSLEFRTTGLLIWNKRVITAMLVYLLSSTRRILKSFKLRWENGITFKVQRRVLNCVKYLHSFSLGLLRMFL